MTRRAQPLLLASLRLLASLLLLALPASAQTDAFLAHIRAGQTALRAGLPLLAAREYRAAVRLRPADADAHYALAGVLEAAGRADEALSEYRRTLALRPDDAPAHNALAGLLEDRGAGASALAEYREAVALAPADPRLHFNLAGALADAGRRAEAAAQYREALRLKPDFAEAAQALRALPAPPIPAPIVLVPPPLTPPELGFHGVGAGGLSLARAGRLREAAAAFRDLLARDPRDAEARVHLGIALYADGRTAQARREWRAVLTLKDAAASAQARRLLARYP